MKGTKSANSVRIVGGKRSRCCSCLEVDDLHVAKAEAGLLQSQGQQEVVDDAGFDADALAPESATEPIPAATRIWSLPVELSFTRAR